MTFNTLFRHLREGTKNVGRNGWMSFASISSITISLFVLGVFLLMSLNMNALADQLENQVEIRVFLELDIEQAEMDKVRNLIAEFPEVSKVTFVSREEGLEMLREMLGDDGKDLLDGFDGDNNPLNDSFTVEVFEPTTVPMVADKIEQLGRSEAEGLIATVKYGKGTVENLFKVTNAVRNFGLILVAGLAITAMFLISNTIKITILARRREIGIMKLVGATNSFIRWPFFVEGALIGLIGSAITSAALLYGYGQLIHTTRFELGLMMIELVGLDEVGWQIALILIGLGMLIGIWGSTISVRKFLKV
jgi:cell division transport system permease protein